MGVIRDRSGLFRFPTSKAVVLHGPRQRPAGQVGDQGAALVTCRKPWAMLRLGAADFEATGPGIGLPYHGNGAVSGQPFNSDGTVADS